MESATLWSCVLEMGAAISVVGNRIRRRDTFAPDSAKGLVTRVAARKEEKGPRSLRTEGLAA